jgi:uncharacterized protein YkwD
MQSKTMLICAGTLLALASLACGDDFVPQEPQCGDLFQPACEEEDLSSAPDMASTPDMPAPRDMSTSPADMSAPPADMSTPPADMAPPACSGGEQRCGGACVSVQDNSQHCGRCDNACGGGTSCVGTTCMEVGELAQIVRIANMHRATGYDCGGQQMPATGPLVMDAKLQIAAQLHAEDMAQQDYFDHTSLDGRSFSTRIRDAGYTASPRGENIAAGNQTPEATMEQWMNSPGHCKNIMSAGSIEIGVGHGTGGSYRHYWVQTFGSR